VTFLAVLELVKEALLDVSQDVAFGPIYVRRRDAGSLADTRFGEMSLGELGLGEPSLDESSLDESRLGDARPGH
jgi:hypothetical protein